MKKVKKTCGHCICYFGGPSAIPPFHEGLAGKCCRCGKINSNEEKVKKHFLEVVMMSGQGDLMFNFKDLWKKIKERY